YIVFNRALVLCFSLLLLLSLAPSLRAQTTPAGTYPNFPSETPDNVQPIMDTWDYSRREEMIPMRDGVKLHTVILVPKGAKNAPILLTRTPYDANGLVGHAQSSHLGPILYGYDNATDVI